MCSKHVHSTVTRSSRFHCLIGVINKPTTVECVYHLYTDDLGWWRGTVVERRSLTGELSLSCARPAADG